MALAVGVHVTQAVQHLVEVLAGLVLAQAAAQGDEVE
jgi:hypothetical protein